MSVNVALCGISDVAVWSESDDVGGKSNDGIVFGKAVDRAVGGKSVGRLWYLVRTMREPLTGIVARPDTKMLVRSLRGGHIRSSLLGLFMGSSKEGRSPM